MGLGLGSGLTTGTISSWSPNDVGRFPELWFEKNSNIIAQYSDDGTEYSETTTGADLIDLDRILRWNGKGFTNKAFHQDVSNDMPRYEADGADAGTLNFASGEKFMNLVEGVLSGSTAETVDFANEFSILIRCKPANFDAARALLGQTASANEFIGFGAGASNLDDSIRMKIDNNTVDFTDSGSNTFSTSEYVTLLIIRDTSNVCKMYVYSETYKSTASGTQWGGATTQSGTATFDNLGCAEDDTANFQGYISHVIAWAVELSADQRELAINYVK